MHKIFRTVAVGLIILVTIGPALILKKRSTLQNSRPNCSTLHQAAVFNAEQIQQLFDAGQRLDQLDNDGNTPLWVAVRFDRPDGVGELLKLGAKPDVGGRDTDTPLLVGTFEGIARTRIVEQLIAGGADVNATSKRYKKTPLHYAVSSSRLETVKLLLNSGADVNARSSSGDTPLQSAVIKGNTPILDLLLASGADPELRNASGFRPIDQLNVAQNPTQIQAVFRAHGADDQRRPELFAAAIGAHETIAP